MFFFIIATTKKGIFAYKTLEGGAGSLYNYDLSNLSFVYFCWDQRNILYTSCMACFKQMNQIIFFGTKASKPQRCPIILEIRGPPRLNIWIETQTKQVAKYHTCVHTYAGVIWCHMLCIYARISNNFKFETEQSGERCWLSLLRSVRKPWGWMFIAYTSDMTCSDGSPCVLTCHTVWQWEN